MSQDSTAWAVALFHRSVLKQAKWKQITRLLANPSGKRNLDIGADNGIISYLLRQRGGWWASADLDAHAVASIRQLVRDDVFQLDGAATPFLDRALDQIVVVDYLEHISDDHAFARELERILEPGGTVIINVPHLKPRSLLNRLRHRIGLTDEWHGHVRPGYDLAGLRAVLGPRFTIERVVTYSKFFSELIDTALNGAYELRRRRQGGTASRKGTVVTGADLGKMQREFRLLRLLYPALWFIAQLDGLCVLQPGYKLIVRATLRPASVS